jgi:hypothetical protein
MQTKIIDKQYSPIAPWNSYSSNITEWSIQGYSFILEQHQLNKDTHFCLYSKDYPQVRMDSTTVSIPPGASKDYIVNLLITRIKLVYDMYVKFNITGWTRLESLQ